MMRKVYTAHEMRVLADRIWDYETMSKGLELCDNELEQVDCEATHDLIHMLRQAADAMERNESLLQRAGATVVGLMNKINAQSSEIAELRECLRLSSNSMEIVVQWLGKHPEWQKCLKNGVARNRKALKGVEE